MDKIAINHLLQAQPKDRVYGFLYLSPKADKMLKIIPDFNTFKEMYEDLSILSKDHWGISILEESPENKITYEVRGNGFLRRKIEASLPGLNT